MGNNTDSEIIDEIITQSNKKMKVKKMNKLNGLRCYLAGPIDHAEDDGKGWREDAEKWFENIDVDEAIIGRLMIERETARSNKDFERADQIRQEIESLGVTIEDGPNGPVWKKR